MALYIKNMEMPKNCLDCGIAVMDEYGESYCPFTNVACLSIGRQDGCPLVEIQEPHGDLIDRNELKKKELVIDGIIHYYEPISIEEAPVIIPASEEEAE